MARWRHPILAGGFGLGLSLLGSSCGDDAAYPPPQAPGEKPGEELPTPPAFERASTVSALGKVKNVLIGQPVTDAELAAVTADPQALRTLVDQWMVRPEFEGRMLAFFQTAFQQGQINAADFADQLPTACAAAATWCRASFRTSARASPAPPGSSSRRGAPSTRP